MTAFMTVLASDTPWLQIGFAAGMGLTLGGVVATLLSFYVRNRQEEARRAALHMRRLERRKAMLTGYSHIRPAHIDYGPEGLFVIDDDTHEKFQVPRPRQ